MVAKNPTKEKTKKSYELGLNEKYFFSNTNEIEITDRLVRKLYYLLHMDIKDIKKKKLRQKLAYLQTELEETKIVYKDSLNTFNLDFATYMTGNEPIENEIHTKIPKDPYEEIQTEIDDETLKNVYRKVAGKTHPDKKDGNEKEFKRANEANKNKDFGQLLEMADEYGIDVPMDDRMMNEVQLQIKAVVDTITNMKSTWAWTWVHIDKGSKDMFKKYILQQLTVE